MPILPTLLQAIVRHEGDALVLQVGERPFVVSASEQIDLPTGVLTDAVLDSALRELLPASARETLDDVGAVQYQLPTPADLTGERFSVVAARVDDGVCVEIRRRRVPDEDYVPTEWFGATDPMLAPSQAASGRAGSDGDVGDDLSVSDLGELWPGQEDRPPRPIEDDLSLDERRAISAPAATQSPHVAPPRVEKSHVEAPRLEPPADTVSPRVNAPSHVAPPLRLEPPTHIVPDVEPPANLEPPTNVAPPPRTEPPLRAEEPRPSATTLERGVPVPFTLRAVAAPPHVTTAARISDRQARATTASAALATVTELLRAAAARGASSLYLVAGARPSLRVDGAIQTLEGPAPLASEEIESLLAGLAAEHHKGTAHGAEWMIDVTGIGRVRCVTFRDQRGTGVIFRLMASRLLSADELGLGREVQALAAEPEGLVLVTGSRASGKSTLLCAFVDLINRHRRSHIITIESEILFVHEPRGSVISQRQVPKGSHETVSAALAALREDPDVLVIEDLRGDRTVSLALEAAEAGHLVLAGLTAHTATEAIDRVLNEYPPQHRRQAQSLLAQTLRGVVAQSLVPKAGGGRLAAREVLLNTTGVSALIAEGRTSQLALAIEAGRKSGMVPLNDSLVAFVESGALDVREAYRRSVDRPGFVAQLKRQGIGASFLDHPA